MTARPSPVDVIRGVMSGWYIETGDPDAPYATATGAAERSVAALEAAGYRIVETIEVHRGYDGDTILGRAARCYLAGPGNYSRDGLERALLGLGLDPCAPWREAASPGNTVTCPVGEREAPDATPQADDATKRTHAIEHGDTWTIRDGHQVIIASHRWPAPAAGTHESNLFRTARIISAPLGPGETWESFIATCNWSRANATKENP